MNLILEECRWLYNHFLEERKTSYETSKTSLSMYDQQGFLPSLKQLRPSLNLVYSQSLQDVALRIDLAFKAFFRRCKSGENPGYPRFKGNGRYHSFSYPQNNNSCKFLSDNCIRLSKIGTVKIKLHRFIEGAIKTCTVSKALTNKWFISFSCEIEPQVLPSNDLEVGIDLGLASFAVLSDGSSIQNPHFYRKEQKALAKVQRKLSKQPKGTPERYKVRKVVAKVHERISNKRNDFCHQETRKIVDKYGTICCEDLNIKNMIIKGEFPKLSKSINDASWGQFLSFLSFKAENAGRTFVKVNPVYTSQDCSECGTRQVLKLSDRMYSCGVCGLSLDRDLNASKNILRVGLHSLGVV